jgi:hypothetical protein
MSTTPSPAPEKKDAPTVAPAAAPATGAAPRKPAPWRVPTVRKGLENTPSCNPNFRGAIPPAR